MYLREMGTVPLLTREGEVEIAKRIERGQLRVLKAISRSPIVIHELLAHWVKTSRRAFAPSKKWSPLTRKKSPKRSLQNRLKEFTGRIDELQKAYKKANQVSEKFADGFAEEAAKGLSPLPLGAGPRAS